jgi:peptidoglycan/xylan/chitin deacetylase (PgdA/CDA1 family)
MINRAQFIKMLGAGAGLAACGGSALALEDMLKTPAPKPVGNAHFVHSGPGFGNRIALTYDDGPTPGVTEKILKELDDRQLKATFFMIGNKVRRYPALAREVVAAGHEVGNHTFTHPSLSKLSDQNVISEITQCQDAIGEATGVTPHWMRPPYGAFQNTRQGPMARQEHLGLAYWSVDPRDWSNPGVSTIVSRVLNGAHPGSIILLHDLKKQTLAATPAILDGLMERRFNLTTISGYLGDPYGSYVSI